jgi:hypothetical protein
MDIGKSISHWYPLKDAQRKNSLLNNEIFFDEGTKKITTIYAQNFSKFCIDLF